MFNILDEAWFNGQAVVDVKVFGRGVRGKEKATPVGGWLKLF